MTQITFFPLGCADTALIELADKRRMLVDYADTLSSDLAGKRCDLSAMLKADLKSAGLTDYCVVAFTHLDGDHTTGASDFFHLEHAAVYQGPGRHKIATLWVPAAAITEEGLTDPDAKVIRAEAHHRLKEGRGIKVFSRPERLKDWFEKNKLSMEDRRGCFVDAGKLVDGFTLGADGVEFFAHSPHATRSDARGIEDRNGGSLVFQARFLEFGMTTDVLFSADVTHEDLGEIVDITRSHGNDDRLHWNVYKLPHHCSYTAVGPEKGRDKTVPTEQVKWLCETQGERHGYVVSPSKPIPRAGTPEDVDVQPPHRQAAEYYRSDVLADLNHLLVTMSEPSEAAPKPIVIAITRDGAIHVRTGSGGAKAAASVVAPRAG